MASNITVASTRTQNREARKLSMWNPRREGPSLLGGDVDSEHRRVD